MIIGLNSELESRINYAYEKGMDNAFSCVLTGIERCVLANDSWLVPVEMDHQDEPDAEATEAALFIGGQEGMLKRIAATKDEEPVFTAFTSTETLHMIDEDGEPEITIRYPVKNILEDLVSSEVCNKLIINPNRRCIVLDKEMAEEILEHAEKKDESFVESEMKVHIEPRAVIDTNELINAWKSDWQEDTVTEEWKLHSYPVMPDGTVLVVYMMDEPICAGYMGTETSHVTTFIRVFRYSINGEKAELLNKYRFKMQDAHVASVFVRDEKLYAVVRPRWGEGYTILQLVPNDDSLQMKIGTDVKRVIPLPDSKLAVAYTRNQHDSERSPLLIYNSDGSIDSSYTDENVLEVSDVSLDYDDNIWFHAFPSCEICNYSENEDYVKGHLVLLPGFNGFGLTDDRSHLVAAYSGGEDEMMINVMKRTKDGNYLHPIRFEFNPADADGKPIINEEDSVTLGSSFMKSTMVLNAAGRLYVYDLNNCCDETRV